MRARAYRWRSEGGACWLWEGARGRRAEACSGSGGIGGSGRWSGSGRRPDLRAAFFCRPARLRAPGYVRWARASALPTSELLAGEGGHQLRVNLRAAHELLDLRALIDVGIGAGASSGSGLHSRLWQVSGSGRRPDLPFFVGQRACAQRDTFGGRAQARCLRLSYSPAKVVISSA